MPRSKHNVSIRNVYSANTVFNDAGDVAAGQANLGVHVALPAGASYSGNFQSSPASPGGRNYLTFQVDDHNIVGESNESDNTYALSLVPDVLSDLVFTSAAITSRMASGVNYTYTLKNNGPGNIPDIHDIILQNLYSANTVFNDAGDLGAGGNIVGVHRALPAGAIYSGSNSSSGAVPAGKGFLTFKIDWNEAVFETNENNNTRALAIL